MGTILIRGIAELVSQRIQRNYKFYVGSGSIEKSYNRVNWINEVDELGGTFKIRVNQRILVLLT